MSNENNVNEFNEVQSFFKDVMRVGDGVINCIFDEGSWMIQTVISEGGLRRHHDILIDFNEIDSVTEFIMNAFLTSFSGDISIQMPMDTGDERFSDDFISLIFKTIEGA
mgnify:FL=1